MRNDVYLIGEVGVDITLEKVIEKVKSTDQSKPLNIHIHSEGGFVYDGLAIYNYLKTLPQEVNTYAVGLVASIASVMLLAGKNRIAYEPNNVLIHLPMNGAMGNAEDLEKAAKDLREVEDKLSNVYASETNFTKEEAIEQMKKDEMLPLKTLLEKGVITEIQEFKAVAKYQQSRKTKTKNKMEKTLSKKDKSWFEKMFNKYLSPKNKVVQDANGVELDFTELEDDATPAIGDKAMVDGSNASGDYTMSNGDVFTFVDGELTEIVMDEGDEATLEEVQAEIVTLTDEVKEAKEDLVKSEKANAKMLKDITKIKSKMTSTFNWDGKSGKGIGTPKAVTRTFVPKGKN